MARCTPNLQKDVRSNQIHNNTSIVSPGGFVLHPIWNIINNKQNVGETKIDKEGTHEIYTLDIKNFHASLKTVGQYKPQSNTL